ncbi:HNH endonuclease signature motif containing protein [Diaminobutyricibacter sp. McL0608]|uniref:HNH endonuclease signature motif containing protein n=1 Tax=Leifsonia sp. McL0608 TaxID=3143537 RepID=UPI0031F33463
MYEVGTTVPVGRITFTIERYKPREDLLDRKSCVHEESGCLLWTGALDRDGYGLASLEGRTFRAHRLSYETRVGPIPEGMQLDHTCERRDCIRPEHLEPVTNFENTVRRFLRQGATRERAEELATQELDRMAESRKADRYAREQAAAAGIRKGMLVRDGRKQPVWKVLEFFTPTVGADVMLVVKPADGETPRRLVELKRARIVEMVAE